MADTSAHIGASPQKVFDQLTKKMDDVEPGPLKVGDTFQMQQPGQQALIYVLTSIESPNRLGYTVTVADNSYASAVEYTIVPDGDGSLVRVEAEGRSAKSPLFGMLIGALKEGEQEKNLLADLQAAFQTPAKA